MTRGALTWVGTAVLGAAGAAFACLWFGGRLDTERIENARLRKREAYLTQQVATLKTALSVSETRAAAAAPQAKAPEKLPANNEYNHAFGAWRQKLALFRHREMRREAWLRYHELFAQLGIAPEKQGALLDLLAAKQETTFDTMDAAHEQGIWDSKEIDLAINQSRDALTAEIADMVGQPGLEALNHAQELKTSQDSVNRGVGTEMQMGGFAMSQEQQAGLAQVFLDVSKQYSTTSGDGFVNQQSEILKHLPESDAMTLDKAAAVLSPDQMIILKQYLDWNGQRVKVLTELPK